MDCFVKNPWIHEINSCNKNHVLINVKPWEPLRNVKSWDMLKFVKPCMLKNPNEC